MSHLASVLGWEIPQNSSNILNFFFFSVLVWVLFVCGLVFLGLFLGFFVGWVGFCFGLVFLAIVVFIWFEGVLYYFFNEQMKI